VSKEILEFEEGLGELLNIIYETQEKTEQDFMILVGGIEGSGKSNLVLDCTETLDGKRGYDTPIENVAFSIKEFAKALMTCRKGAIIILDEAKELEASNWQAKEVKEFKKAITKIRKAGHIYFVCFPNPLSMTGYVKYDKAFAVAIVAKRGLVYVYSKELFNKLMEKMKTPSIANILAHKPNFRSKFPIYKGSLKKAYDDKKDSAIVDAKQEFGNAMGIYKGAEDISGLMRMGQAAAMFGVSPGTLNRWVRNGLVVPARTLPDGSCLFSRESVLTWIEESKDPERARLGRKGQLKRATDNQQTHSVKR